MWFSSLEFLFFFFPVVLGINYILPRKARNYWLLAASLFFYAWGEPNFFLLLIISIIVNFGFGTLLDRANWPGEEVYEKEQWQEKHRLFRKADPEICRKALFVLALVLDLLPLIVYKYMNTITGLIRSAVPVWRGMIPQTSFILPLAISFYTFQSISYIYDIFRGMSAEKNPCWYALFISFFPQMVQGPILRYSDFRPQLEDRKITSEGFSEGIIRFLTGFNQKVLLANFLSETIDAAYKAKGLSVGMAWLAMLAVTLQMYFDFAGYTDMAIGLGKMFGFRIAENFDFPFLSRNMSELWRRWHITLGTWFRDYVYYPLGGSRVKTKARIALNLAIVWAATTIWHGTLLQYILFGICNGLSVILEKLTDLPKKLREKPVSSFLYRVWVLFFFNYAGMVFHAADFPQAVTFTKALFKLDGNPWTDNLFIFQSREIFITFCFALICGFPLCKKLRERISAHGPGAASAVRLVWFLIQMLLAVVSVSCLVTSTHDPFLYANF